MTYHVQLEIFDGPLDLLLHLIERSELDIYDIPIAVITEQFLGYLRAMESLNLEIAGEFLVMAATLMQIKAKMLLPKPITLTDDEDGEAEEDPRRELVDRLIEYRRFKEAAAVLRQYEEEQLQFHPRGGGEFADQTWAPVTQQLQPLSVWELLDAFQAVMGEFAPDGDQVPVPAEEINVKQFMTEIMDKLSAQSSVAFAEIFGGLKTRRGLVTAFVALLELIRTGRVMAFQDRVFGRIMLSPRPVSQSE